MNGKCVRCSKLRRLSFRGLCRSCSVYAGRRDRPGSLEDWPAVVNRRRSLAEFAEDFAFLEARGLSFLGICRQLGYSEANDGSSMKSLIIRAQHAGLLPKRTPLCGWRPKR